MNPVVTVLMPVYNGEKYLREAIDSILAQTYTHFEFLIINDGSTDSSEKIILSYDDSRIRYVKNSKNIGLSRTLNKGLDLAQGIYIARMDCDDLSAKTRLEKQVEFLNTHDEYGIVGSLFALINPDRSITELGGTKLLENEDLKLSLLFGNVFCHGETMIRKSVIDKYAFKYDTKYVCEDYDLWIRMSKVTKFKNLPDILYFYMVNEEGVSSKKRTIMDIHAKKLADRHMHTEGLPYLSLSKFGTFLYNGRQYHDHIISLSGVRMWLYLQLSYQVFLFRLGKIYLQKMRFDGLLLFIVSFLINPLNWIRHLFGLFPKDSPYFTSKI